MRLILALLLTFTSLASFALTFDGLISKTKNKTLFVDNINKKTYTLTGNTAIISTYLAKLSEGDFISIEGTRNTAQTILTVSSVNYIGLSALLGSWIDDKSYCYNFSSFTEFSVTQKVIGRKCAAGLTPNYTYIINPASTSWVMLISGERGGGYIGDLKFISPREIEIQLYDSETGDILSYIQLRK
ncbi:MAG: hypothetical protein ABL930_08320 [Pseudobdellovibrio sp.]